MESNRGVPDSPLVPASGDDPAAAESLFPLLYEELRRYYNVDPASWVE